MESIKTIPSDKQTMLDKYKASGKSIKQYCLEENIPYHLMGYWQRKEKFLATGKDKKFIKVKIKEPLALHQNKTELIFSNGNKIVFYGAININELKQLAK